MPSMTICKRRQPSSTCCSHRVYSSAVKKQKITKSEEEDVVRKIRAPTAVVHQYTTTSKRVVDSSTCNKLDDSRTIQPVAAAETRRKQLVQVERLGGLKLRFRFSRNIHQSKSSGDIDVATPPVQVVRTNKLAVQEIISSDDDDERKRSTMRLWRQMKLQREREAARRKMESITKTVDISNNYYDTMSQLDRMFGDSEWVMEAFYGARNEKPLEKLGLFLKV